MLYAPATCPRAANLVFVLMRRSILSILLALALGLAALPVAAQPSVGASTLAPHVPGELLVRFTPNQSPATPGLAALLARLGVRAVTPLFLPADTDQIYKLTFDPGRDLAAVATALLASGFVAYAEPNFLVAAADYIPDDPAYSASGLISPSLPDLWGLHVINMGAAWELTTGSPTVIVAVVDTGLDPSHPELANRLWQNPGELANGLDDDGNGYVDDRAGWDFSADTALAADDNGHGTHIAGTIAAAGDNGQGVAGIAWGVRLMAIKALDRNGFGSLELGARAIRYAADMGAQVINCSWGASSSSQVLADAVAYAQSSGALVVAAAGNSAVEDNTFVPATLPGVLSVAATDPGDGRSSFSNYGSTVDVAAPGRDILSLLAAGTESRCARRVGTAYCLRNGTSMAAAHVAGLAALLRSRFPAWPPEAIGEQIRASATNIDAALGPYAGLLGSGRIDAGAALRPDLGTLAGTVQNSAGLPIAGAMVQAGSLTVVTNPDGSYLFPSLPAGSYILSAGQRGYRQQRLALDVVAGATLTHDFSLAEAEPALLSGQIREAGHGWPLYARIVATTLGDARVAFSDPVSGTFTVELDAEVPYSFTIQALTPGYQDSIFELALAPGNAERVVALIPDLRACAAPGYGLQGGSCLPQAGALMVGTVFDAVGGAGLPGAQLVAGTSSAIASATPADPAQPDGRYALFIPANASLLRVEHGGYEALAIPVRPEPDSITQRDLRLTPLYRPALVAAGGSAWGMPGTTVVHALRLENRGSRTDGFALSLVMGPGCTGLPWRAAILEPGRDLAAGAAANLTLGVTVPATASYGATCAISLAADSRGDNTARASLTIDTQAGLRLATVEATALPATSISRTLVVEGWTVGMADPLVTIAVAGGRWPIIAPASARIADLARNGLTLTAAVPPTALAGEQGSAEVRLLADNGAELARAGITITALPVYSPTLATLGSSSASVTPGERTSFRLRLSNSGNITASYALTVSPEHWPIELPARLGPLAPGATAIFTVDVQIPAQARARETLIVTARAESNPASVARLDLAAVRSFPVFLPLLACPLRR